MKSIATGIAQSILCLLAICVSVTSIANEPEKNTPPKWDVNKPPGASYQVPIDTRTGTWMSVDVSPDGQQIVFDLLGDLYLLPIAGGEAKALTHSIAWEMQARFSPDGKKLSYMSDPARRGACGATSGCAATGRQSHRR